MAEVKRYFDLLVCVPLEVELQEFYRIFPPIEDLTKNFIQRYTVNTGEANVNMLVVAQDEMGRTSARRCVAAALEDYNAGMVVCLGIAGGLSDDLSLGAVCYSGTVIDVYDNAKVVDLKEGMDSAFSPTHLHTDRAITSALNFLRSNPALGQAYSEWQSICASNATDELLKLDDAKLLNTFEFKPLSLNGTIACGQVSDSRTYNERLKKLDRKLLAIETESGGVFMAAEEHSHFKYLTIRGISDYAENKSAIEKSSKGIVRRIAAYNAAAFLRSQLSNPHFAGILQSLNSGNSTGPIEVIVPSDDDLASIVAKIETDIDEKLHELSPEYKLTDRGYGLPIPRIKPSGYETSLPTSQLGPAEVEDVIAKVNAIVIEIPRTYPDDGLAWVIGHSLITKDLDRKQLLPFVLDGKQIGPPGNGFVAQKGKLLDFLRTNPTDGIPVFIIDNPPLTSRTRTMHLISECRSYPDAKFIFVVRGEPNTAASTTLGDALGVQAYSLCPISFEGIAHFVQKYCQLPPQEADVIALRLTETFERFGLLAHPTYFAGIPKEVLVALLQANRRAELIQLAVDGFLTLLVAGDEADITLSRTTRERFLRNLVVETKAKGRVFSVVECLEFTSDFASRYDFDIEPVEFMQAFLQNGILHYYKGEVRFALPFIESYLLASELASKPALAVQYFDIETKDFDFAAFDLYAEMGADGEVVERVIGKLSSIREDLALPDKNIILTSEASPKLLGQPDALRRVQKRLEVAMKNVRENQQHTQRKQRLIDLSNDIRQSVTKQRVENTERSEDWQAESEEEFLAITKYWVIGVVLLGSGAEHLYASGKVALTEAIAEVSAIIVDKWTRRNQAVDFDQIRETLFDEVISEKMEFSNEDEKQEVRQLFINVADVLEHNFMSEPVRRVLGFLGEQARHKVLVTSLEKADPADSVGAILKAAWLCDIDVRKGGPALGTLLKKAPAAPLMRISLATHLMAQVFWRHSEKGTQLALLEAANETIKPLELAFDKGQIKRDIEQGRVTAPEHSSGSSSQNRKGGPEDRKNLDWQRK